MREKRRVGITFGCFIPLHKGHLSIIKQAETENNSVILGVTGHDMDRGRDFIPFLRRLRLMHSVYASHSKVTISEVDDRAIGLAGTFSLSAWKRWCDELFYGAGYHPNDPRNEFHWYIGEKSYIEKIETLYPEHHFHLMDRSIIPLSGTAIREDPERYSGYIHPVFLDYLKKNGQIPKS